MAVNLRTFENKFGNLRTSGRLSLKSCGYTEKVPKKCP